MGERAEQSSDRTEGAEADEQPAINVTPQHQKPHGRRQQVRNRDGSNREFERDLRCQQGCQQTADAESGYGCNASRQDGQEEKRGFKQLAMHEVVARLQITTECRNQGGSSVEILHIDHLVG